MRLEVGRAGEARVKRMIYPPGFRWSMDMKPVVGTDLCMHAHVGFLAHGEIHIEYADGCVVEHKAPQIVAIEPGHDGWVVGNEPVVLIEFDFERNTIGRLGHARSAPALTARNRRRQSVGRTSDSDARRRLGRDAQSPLTLKTFRSTRRTSQARPSLVNVPCPAISRAGIEETRPGRARERATDADAADAERGKVAHRREITADEYS